MNFTVISTNIYRQSYNKLNAKDQKSVTEALDLWMEQPKAYSLRFKKLPSQGNNIFSFRGTRGVRVILAKFDGDYYLLQTGKDHDKTNDWARNKKVDKNNYTGFIQLYSVPVETFEASEQAPAVYTEESSLLFAKYSADQLRRIGVPEDWIEPLRLIKDEDEFLENIQYLPTEVVEDLDKINNGMNIKVLIAQIEAEKERKEQMEKKEQIRAQPGFFVQGEDDELIKAMEDDINIFRFYLHPLQNRFAYGSFNGPVKLSGGAGTGKTVVAMHRAKHLVEQLEEGKKPVFFTTYTKALIRNIASTFASQDLPVQKLKVSNLHKYVLRLAKDVHAFPENTRFLFNDQLIEKHWQNFVAYLGEIPFTAAFLQSEYEQVIQEQHILTLDQYLDAQRKGRGEALVASKRKLVWDLFKKYDLFLFRDAAVPYRDLIFKVIKTLESNPDLAPFSHIVCDEIQDFTNLELRLLRKMVPEGRDDLFLTGDPFQNIFGRKINFSQSGINIRGKRSSRLRINYRTTEQIRSFAVSMLDGFEYNDFSGNIADNSGDASRLSGYNPQYFHFENREEELDFILRYLKDSYGKIGMHEVCITATRRTEMEELEGFLKANKIAFTKLSEVEDLSNIHGQVILGRMRQLKGLEFKNIIFSGLNKSNFPYLPERYHNMSADQKKDFLKKLHALYYVVFSRPISQLILTGSGEPVESLSRYLVDGVEV
jgi:superfamily I DNA/RNA helicase